MRLIPLPAFSDNYLWFLHDGARAMVVDPGDAQPVLDALERLGLVLESILVTHHHMDHTGGVDRLREATGALVFGPARENIPQPFKALADGDLVDTLGLQFQVIDVPGHTSGHIAYWCADVACDPDGTGQPLLFCGDTLFSGGCGRLFEGTPAQMLGSLDRLAALPGNTQVCCTHEYTLSNLRFAVEVEPANPALRDYQAACVRLRDNAQPTLPSNLALELQINPFLRSRQPAVIDATRRFEASSALRSEAPTAHVAAGAQAPADEVAVFAALREWKNRFR